MTLGSRTGAQMRESSYDELIQASGPILLIAGPGTGKTYQLARRIRYLTGQDRVSPDEVTVITFTDAAARNMHARISDPAEEELLVPPEKQPKLICTMHSLGLRIIRENAEKLGLVGSLAMVTDDRLRSVLASDAAQLCGHPRIAGKGTSDCRMFGDCNRSGDVKCVVCRKYQSILRSCSAVDYDDHILIACEILEQYAAVAEKYQKFCRHLLVDEYQDMNAGQFRLIRLLSATHPQGLFAVGDDDQSIYSWRGGSPRFIRNFLSDFGEGARVETLQLSHRCQPHVLEGAVAVVEEYDAKRHAKPPFDYRRTEGQKIVIHNVPTGRREAQIIRYIAQSSLPVKSILVLVPYRNLAEPIVEELRKAGIECEAPVSIPGEGLPLLATLGEWIENPDNSLALRACLEAYVDSPTSGVPSSKSRKAEKLQERELTLQKISNLWECVLSREAPSLWNALIAKKDSEPIYTRIHSDLCLLRDLIDAKATADFANKISNLFHPWASPKSLLTEVGLWVRTSRRTTGGPQPTTVQLMTLQGAKGLEADVVCVAAVEEGTLPRSKSDDEALAEQARLLYVSMTRAKDELHIFHSRTRSPHTVFRAIYRDGQPPDLQASRYLAAIPDAHKDTKYHGPKQRQG
jgi:DNA helicase-2/ATP-dependent DNA helicase PcrA